MGFQSAVNSVLKVLTTLATRSLFAWWVTVILVVDVLLLLYHLMIQGGIYPPTALFIIEMLAFMPLLFVVILGGAIHGRLRTKAHKRSKRKSYARLEDRARI